MAAWGYGALEDDQGLDWIGDFLKAPSVNAIRNAFSTALQADDRESWIAAGALAAAEVVAALNGQASPKLADDVVVWVDGQPAADSALLAAARKTVKKVFADSELREIWEGDEQLDPWRAAMKELLSRLR